MLFMKSRVVAEYSSLPSVYSMCCANDRLIASVSISRSSAVRYARMLIHPLVPHFSLFSAEIGRSDVANACQPLYWRVSSVERSKRGSQEGEEDEKSSGCPLLLGLCGMRIGWQLASDADYGSRACDRRRRFVAQGRGWARVRRRQGAGARPSDDARGKDRLHRGRSRLLHSTHPPPRNPRDQ